MMSDVLDKKFGQLVGLLQAMELAYVRATTESYREQIAKKITKAMREMTDQQLEAYVQYTKKTLKDSEADLANARDIALKLESEVNRRQKLDADM